MRSALELHLAGLAEDGLPLPKPSARAEVVRLRVQAAAARRVARAR
jgi:predicted RNase H-like HicB family nuclease